MQRLEPDSMELDTIPDEPQRSPVNPTAAYPSGSPMADNEAPDEAVMSEDGSDSVSSSNEEEDEGNAGDSERKPRNRKSVQRLAETLSPAKTSSKKTHLADSGSGAKLGEIAKIAEKLNKVAVKDESLKRLHRVLYGSDGAATTRKKAIRLWNGTDDDSVKATMANALTGAKSVAMLKDIAVMLSVSTGGDRMSLEARIIEFLVKPSGSSAPSKKRQKKSSNKHKHTAASTTTWSRRNSSAGSGFSQFLKQRMPEVIDQAAGSMSARDVTDLLTLEWKNMSHDERSEYEPKTERVIDEEPRIHKVIRKKKSPRKSESTEEQATDSSSSDSGSSSGSSDRSSSSGSDSDE